MPREGGCRSSRGSSQTCPLSCGCPGRVRYPELTDELYGVPGRWAILECSGCGVWYLSPRPAIEELPGFYVNYHTHSRAVVGNVGRESWSRYFKQLCRRVYFGAIPGARDFEERFLGAVKPGRLCDVACGNGSWLARMKARGWQVVGVDVDAQAASVACETYGVPVYVGAFEKASMPENSFDAITICHGIEHVADPVETLRSCFRLLRPGGLLSVITPNTRSLGSRWFRARWRGLEPPRHLVLFSPRLLRSVLQREGFSILRLETTARTACQIYCASVLKGRTRRLGALLFLIAELALNSITPCWGEEIGVLASKPALG